MPSDVTHPYVTWLLIRNMTPWLIHMSRDSFICDVTRSYVTWLIHMWRDSFICDVTHSTCDSLHNSRRRGRRWRASWGDSTICHTTLSYVTWLRGSFTSDVTPSYVMWLISYVTHFTIPGGEKVTKGHRNVTHSWVTCLGDFFMCNVTHLYVP